MQLDALLLRELFLLELELTSQVEQTHFLLLFRDHLIEKRKVVAEEENRVGLRDLRLFAHVVFEKDRRHGRDVLVAEAQIGARESRISRLNEWDADLAALVD